MLRVLIYDSGMGGLSISQSLSEYIPFAQQILLADNAFFPYGEMDEERLINRVSDLLLRAEAELKPDCIVIACNTVSTIALDSIRKAINVPVIGVVPAIKPAAKISSSKVIGLLATPATLSRSYTNDLISSYADSCTIISVGTTRLVEIAELTLSGITVNMTELEVILHPLITAAQEQTLDVIVLGCTHFPLVAKYIAQLIPKTITLLDSSTAIAYQVKKVLQQYSKQLFIDAESSAYRGAIGEQKHRCFMTKPVDESALEIGLKPFGFSGPEYFN